MNYKTPDCHTYENIGQFAYPNELFSGDVIKFKWDSNTIICTVTDVRRINNRPAATTEIFSDFSGNSQKSFQMWDDMLVQVIARAARNTIVCTQIGASCS